MARAGRPPPHALRRGRLRRAMRDEKACRAASARARRGPRRAVARLRAAGLEAPLEVGFLTPEGLARMPAKPGTIELARRGRVVAGDAAVLGRVPRWSARDVPREESGAAAREPRVRAAARLAAARLGGPARACAGPARARSRPWPTSPPSSRCGAASCPTAPRPASRGRALVLAAEPKPAPGAREDLRAALVVVPGVALRRRLAAGPGGGARGMARGGSRLVRDLGVVVRGAGARAVGSRRCASPPARRCRAGSAAGCARPAPRRRSARRVTLAARRDAAAPRERERGRAAPRRRRRPLRTRAARGGARRACARSASATRALGRRASRRGARVGRRRARRPAQDGDRVKPVLVILFVDALGWRLAGSYPGFAPALAHRREIATILGFSSGALPTAFSGRLPREHGRWLMYRRAGADGGVVPRVRALRMAAAAAAPQLAAAPVAHAPARRAGRARLLQPLRGAARRARELRPRRARRHLRARRPARGHAVGRVRAPRRGVARLELAHARGVRDGAAAGPARRGPRRCAVPVHGRPRRAAAPRGLGRRRRARAARRVRRVRAIARRRAGRGAAAVALPVLGPRHGGRASSRWT